MRKMTAWHDPVGQFELGTHFDTIINHYSIYYILFIYINKRPSGPVANRKGFKGVRVGGQGFDPCLIHIIFLNMYLQIQCYHAQRSHLTPQIHHHQIIPWPDLTLPMKLHIMDSHDIATQDHTQLWAKCIGLWTEFQIAPSKFGFTPLRPIPSLFISLFYFV